MRIPKLVIGTLALLSLVSCSTSSRMSVGGPGSLVARPAAKGPGAEPSRFARRDELESADHGFVLISGDSMVLFDRREGLTGLTGGHPATYRPLRVVRTVSISAYQTRDGHWHHWAGAVRPAGDSLEITMQASRPAPLRLATRAETLRVARDEIRALDVDGQDPVRAIVGTTLALTLFGAVAFFFLLLGFASRGFS